MGKNKDRFFIHKNPIKIRVADFSQICNNYLSFQHFLHISVTFKTPCLNG